MHSTIYCALWTFTNATCWPWIYLKSFCRVCVLSSTTDSSVYIILFRADSIGFDAHEMTASICSIENCINIGLWHFALTRVYPQHPTPTTWTCWRGFCACNTAVRATARRRNDLYLYLYTQFYLSYECSYECISLGRDNVNVTWAHI